MRVRVFSMRAILVIHWKKIQRENWFSTRFSRSMLVVIKIRKSAFIHVENPSSEKGIQQRIVMKSNILLVDIHDRMQQCFVDVLSTRASQRVLYWKLGFIDELNSFLKRLIENERGTKFRLEDMKCSDLQRTWNCKQSWSLKIFG